MAGSKKGFGWLAFAVSLLVPGAGHAMRARPLRGSAWLIAEFAIFLGTVLLARYALSVVIWGAAWAFVVYLVCAVDAGRTQPAIERATTRAWLVFTAVMVLMGFIAPALLSFQLRRSVVEAFKIPSGTMCPTLVPGDHVFVDKTVYSERDPERGDVIVYRRNETEDFVKRVVAVGGDEIEVRENQVILNGSAIPKTKIEGVACEGAKLFEEDLGTRHSIAIDDHPGENFKGRVPAGTVFVMGDNRNNSMDSRFTGPVRVDDVRGRVVRVWMRTEENDLKPVWLPVD